jgi:hypothetical protein
MFYHPKVAVGLPDLLGEKISRQKSARGLPVLLCADGLAVVSISGRSEKFLPE